MAGTCSAPRWTLTSERRLKVPPQCRWGLLRQFRDLAWTHRMGVSAMHCGKESQ